MKTTLMLGISLLLAAQAVSQDAVARPPFGTVRGAFIGISTPDIDAGVKWYSEKLGLTLTMRTPKSGKSAAAVLEGGGLIVELMQHDDSLPPAKATFLVQGTFKAGLVVDDLNGTLAVLKARGVVVAMGPFPATETQRANVLIRDNAGNLIQFFQR
jgi:catechol 2,3-dioxygenase-like lactoylglutathione lyase family enzyme